MWLTIKKIIGIGIPVVWLIIFVPKFIPTLNTVRIEESHQPIVLYEYSEPGAITGGDNIEREMYSMPLKTEPSLLAKIWSPIKTVLSELKEVLSTIALLFQVGMLIKNKGKRLTKK